MQLEGITFSGGVLVTPPPPPPPPDVLLLHLDGANNSTTFTDSSIYNNTMTATAAGVVISTNQFKFGGASMWVTGPGIRTPDSALFSFGNQPFTVEGWIYPLAVSNPPASVIITTRPGSSYAQWEINLTNDGLGNAKLGWLISNDAVNNWSVVQQPIPAPNSISIPYNQWSFIAFVGDGANLKLFANGVASGSTPAQPNWAPATTTVYLGTGGEAPQLGYYDEWRISKGVALYSSNFTPPTAPFPNP